MRNAEGAEGQTERTDPESGPTEHDVARFLRHHPDFLVKHPELLSSLAPPTRRLGDGILDMQQFMIERLRNDLSASRASNAELVTLSRSNQASQSRAFRAALALLNARTFEHLIEILTTDLAVHLGVDVASLCVEQTRDGPPRAPCKGVQILEVGTVDRLLGRGRDVLLRPDAPGDQAIFGSVAGLVRSDALVRLGIGRLAPPGLLAIGSRAEGWFQTGQGTELMAFLGRIVERSIRSWLNLPA